MPPKQGRTLRLGTRGSKLARWQADWVAGELRRLGHAVELVEIATRGDLEQVVAVEEIGTRGVFTKEIQRALLAGDVDLAVHSLKDLPTEPVEGLVLAAVPTRESSADVLVGRGAVTLESLPHAAHVGTGSLRRQAQLRHVRPDLRVTDVRGNVDTRLRKLDEGQFDALVLAEAGLRRLELADRISQVLPLEVMLPAVGQGALGIECRANDAVTLAILELLNDAATHAAVAAERALLEHLRGGCMAPVGALGRVVGDTIKGGTPRAPGDGRGFAGADDHALRRGLRDVPPQILEGLPLNLSAVVLSADGQRRLTASEVGSSSEAKPLGVRVADVLLRQGAAELIAASRNE